MNPEQSNPSTPTPADNSAAIAPAAFGEKVRITQLGLDFLGDLSFDEWRELAPRLGNATRSMAFVVGDWLVYGEDRFAKQLPLRGMDAEAATRRPEVSGERYNEAVTATGIDRAVLKIYVHVSRRVPKAMRINSLSWEHHKAVARLAPPEQQRWLGIAAAQPHQERISSRRLRASIIKGRVVSVAEMAVPPSEQGISNHIPPINRLSVWWKTVGGADFLKGRNREQLAALRRDFNPVTAILKQIDDAIVRKLQDTLL